MNTVADLAVAVTPPLVYVYLSCVHASAVCAYYCLHPLILCLFTFFASETIIAEMGQGINCMQIYENYCDSQLGSY